MCSINTVVSLHALLGDFCLHMSVSALQLYFEGAIN